MSFNKVDQTTGVTTPIAGLNGITIDSTPTEGSTNAVQSGGVYDALSLKQFSNPNLLDNPWFTVNQRGFSSTSSSGGYTVDRWKNSYGDLTISLSNNVLTFTKPDTSTDSALVQYIPMDTGKYLLGKTLTYSVLLEDDEICSTTFTLPSEVPASQKFYGFRKIPNKDIEYFYIDFCLHPNGAAAGHEYYVRIGSHVANATISIKAVKLEIGSVSTLAMDTVPNYQQELAKCQRYFVRYNANNIVSIASAYAVSTSDLRFDIPLPVVMRSEPSVSYSALTDFVYTLTTYANGTNPTSIASAGNSFGIMKPIKFGGTFTTSTLYEIDCKDGYLDLSADL